MHSLIKFKPFYITMPLCMIFLLLLFISGCEVIDSEEALEESYTNTENALTQLPNTPETECANDSTETIAYADVDIIPLYNISGYFIEKSDGRSFRIEQHGNTLTVWDLDKRRGPFFGWYYTPTHIAVNFTDDPGCCTARISGNGEVLRWSNNYIWILR